MKNAQVVMAGKLYICGGFDGATGLSSGNSVANDTIQKGTDFFPKIQRSFFKPTKFKPPT